MSTAELEAQKAEIVEIDLDDTREAVRRPWELTPEERKERIRRSEEDYEAGRLHTTEEVFAKYK
jgi:hypothetical protein